MAHHIPTLLQPASPLILGTLRPMPLSSLLSFTSYPCRLVCYQPYKQPDLFNSSIAVNGLNNAGKVYRPCMSLNGASVPLDSHCWQTVGPAQGEQGTVQAADQSSSPVTCLHCSSRRLKIMLGLCCNWLLYLVAVPSQAIFG